MLLNILCKLLGLVSNRINLVGRSLQTKKYDPTDFISTSLNNTSFSNISSNNQPLNASTGSLIVWQHELEIALFDVPMKHLNGNVYSLVKESVEVSNHIKKKNIIYFIIF